MDDKTWLLITLFVTVYFPYCNAGINTILTVAGKVYDVVELGVKVKEAFDKFEVDETPSNLEELVDRIGTRIDKSTTDIITAVTLQSKLDRIDDAVISIHSSLIDLKNILQANTADDRDEYIRLFVKRFEEHDLIKHVRFLPELLEYNIPGTTGQLVDLFAEKTRCNMTTIYEFSLFYIDLLSDGILLEIIYLRQSTILSLKRTSEEWSSRLIKIAQVFDDQETDCKSMFPVYAQEDVENANDAVTLWASNKERYTWKNSDVLFLKPFGTYQFLYYSKWVDHLFWHKSDKNKFVIFTDKHETIRNSSMLSDVIESLKASIQGERDKNAAKNVANAVKNHVEGLGYYMQSVIVYFEDGGTFSSEQILIDQDSPVLQVSIKDVKLSYCYDSGFRCTTDPISWTKVWKTVNGNMEVFAYVTNVTVSPKEIQTGSSARKSIFTVLFYLFLTSCIELLRTN